MQTVPRRPGGGAHRAVRSVTPSGVFSIASTAPSGTGLAGIETSFIGRALSASGLLIAATDRQFQVFHNSLKTHANHCFNCISRPPVPLLQSHAPLPICFLRRPFGCVHERSGLAGGSLRMSLNSLGGYAMRTFDLAPLY